MRKRITLALVPMLLLMMSAACSQVPGPSAERPAPSVERKDRMRMNQTVAGSYIVKVAGDAEPRIKQFFAAYDVTAVHAMGNELYEMRLGRDPGIEVLRSAAAGSDGAIQAIQPNFIYRAN
jgi:hypothetical protein